MDHIKIQRRKDTANTEEYSPKKNSQRWEAAHQHVSLGEESLSFLITEQEELRRLAQQPLLQRPRHAGLLQGAERHCVPPAAARPGVRARPLPGATRGHLTPGLPHKHLAVDQPAGHRCWGKHRKTRHRSHPVKKNHQGQREKQRQAQGSCTHKICKYMSMDLNFQPGIRQQRVTGPAFSLSFTKHKCTEQIY